MIAINGHPFSPSVDSFFITEEYGGAQTLQFDIHPKDPLYNQVAEEAPVDYGGQHYLIKGINERKSVSTITCELDLDVFRQRVHRAYQSEDQTLSTLLSDVLPQGWSSEGDELVSEKRTIELEDCTDYDVLQQAMETYGVALRWDTGNRVLQILKPENMQPTGVYLTDELNLTNLCFKGSSSDFVTRLYPYGKDGLNIVSVNDGVEYVENHDYSDKVISAVWTDSDCTDPTELRDLAVAQLKTLACPTRSYTCTVSDFGKTNGPYKHLQMGLYSVVTLIDSARGTRMDHQVVEYKQYPLHPSLNVVTLSSVPEKLSGRIDRVETNVGQTADRLNGKINEISRDVDTNTARINQTYTRGETNAEIENRITQSVRDFRVEISETYADKDSVEQSVSELEQTIDGLTMRVSTRGGSNLLHGTAFFNLDSWTVDGDGSASVTRTSPDLYLTESGGALLLTTGSVSQTVRVVPGGQYCWMLRYKLTGALESGANLSVAGLDTPLPPADEWTAVRGNFIASGQTASVTFTNSSGTLAVADLVLMPGMQVDAWQAAQDEILSDEMYFANGKLGVGSAGSPLRTAITNTQFAVENTETGQRVIYAGVEGAQLDETTVRKSLTVQSDQTANGAYVVLPLGNGHVLHTIKD